MPRCPRCDDPLELLLVLAARAVGRELGVVGELRLVHCLAQTPVDIVRVRGDHDPFVVARLEDVRRGDTLQPGAARPADDAEPVVLGDHALEQREAAFHQRDVDDLTAAPAEHVAPVERCEDSLHGEHARQRVAEREVDARRRLAREAVDVPDSAHRLRDRRKAGARSVRARLPVAGDARDHELGIRLPQPRRRKVPLLQRPRAKVLGQHVAALHELEQQLLSARLAQVQRDALLVAGLDGPPERPPLVARVAPVAKRVRLARRLDLDDLGAHVAEQTAGERACEQHPQLDDADACERSRAAGRHGGSVGRGVGHARSPTGAVYGCSRRFETRRSRASKTCSFMISSARSESRAASAVTICRW